MEQGQLKTSSSRRNWRKKQQEDIFRREILSVALELFSVRGFHNVSMQEIAQKAEFGLGTLYKIFGNKDNLYKELVLERARECNTLIKKGLCARTSPLNRITSYVDAKLKFFKDNRAFVRLYLTETQGARFTIRAGLDKELKKFHDKTIALLEQAFTEGISSEIFIRVSSPRLLAVALDGLTNSMIVEWLENKEEGLISVSNILRLFLGPIATEKALEDLKAKGVWEE